MFIGTFIACVNFYYFEITCIRKSFQKNMLCIFYVNLIFVAFVDDKLCNVIVA